MTSRRARVKTTTTYDAPHSTVGVGTQGDALYLSRSDIQYSIDAFRAVLQTATAYRGQLEKTSHDASNFALALEQLARTDLGSDGVGAGLQACAGFHNLISNQNHVLGDALYKTFERPLEEHCSDYAAKLKSDEIEYEQTVAVLGESIRRTEARSFNLGRRGERDLNTFRSAITDLTQQVDDLEAVKAAYYEGLRDTRALSLSLVLHTASEVVRAEVDVYEKIASKGITDPILQGMISSVPDPFESYPTSSSSEIFSILPPLLSNGFGNDHLIPHQSNNATQPEIYRISEAATVVDGDDVDGERRQSEFSNGGDSFKHDTGTVNAFAALFGATINEVWAGQEDDEDEEEDNGNGNEDCNGNEQVQEEEEVQEEEVHGEEGVPGEEEAQGDKGEAEKYDDRDEEVNGDKEDEDYKFEEAQEVNDEDEVEEPDRTAGDGSGKSEALYEVDHTFL